ncbi:MAG: hypothetical protein R6V75_00965, partial [Bacteroidales bacterium]
LRIAKEIYLKGIDRYEELARPYASVLHIDRKCLPAKGEVLAWNSARFANTLIHDSRCRDYNPHFRQLIHIAYPIAAEMGNEFTGALEHYRTPVEEQVYVNLLERHLKPLFP